jgi:hypothetical protein
MLHLWVAIESNLKMSLFFGSPAGDHFYCFTSYFGFGSRNMSAIGDSLTFLLMVIMTGS